MLNTLPCSISESDCPINNVQIIHLGWNTESVVPRLCSTFSHVPLVSEITLSTMFNQKFRMRNTENVVSRLCSTLSRVPLSEWDCPGCRQNIVILVLSSLHHFLSIFCHKLLFKFHIEYRAYIYMFHEGCIDSIESY